MATLCILDGMALIYRAFYAFINNPMRNSTGLNTSAMFGFINTVVHLIGLFRSFPHFLIGLFVFLVLSCISCLYILEIDSYQLFLCDYSLPF